MSVPTIDTTSRDQNYTARLPTGRKDMAALDALLRRGIRPGVESPQDIHLNELIPKPWGYEYRAYADPLQDVWQLCLAPGHRTSMHAHPRKVTYLLCLRGHGRLGGLDGSVEIVAGDVVKIDRGAFHQTANIDPSTDLHLLEVETPRNKFDLVRLSDDYDRAGRAYETRSERLESVIRKVPYIPGGHMCRQSPAHDFGFDVTAGMDLHYRGIAGHLFHVPIGAPALYATDLEILGGLRNPGATPVRDSYYLSVRVS